MTMRADPSAAPLLAAIHAACGADNAWDEAAFAALLAMPGAFAFATAEGFVLARSAAGEAELIMLAVVPAARRRGLGRHLVAEAIGEARRRGAATLFLEVAESNAPARALYAGFGFCEIGRRRRYYPDGTDAVVLRCAVRSCGN